MEEKKYELVKDVSIEFEGRTLYRIRALKDFNNVKKGDIGGYVENEENLSHEGDCWIYNDAKVFGNAKIFDNAIVCNSMIFGNASVSGNARVFGNANIGNNNIISGNSEVYYNCEIHDQSEINSTKRICSNNELIPQTILTRLNSIYSNDDSKDVDTLKQYVSQIVYQLNEKVDTISEFKWFESIHSSFDYKLDGSTIRIGGENDNLYVDNETFELINRQIQDFGSFTITGTIEIMSFMVFDIFYQISNTYIFMSINNNTDDLRKWYDFAQNYYRKHNKNLMFVKMYDIYKSSPNGAITHMSRTIDSYNILVDSKLKNTFNKYFNCDTLNADIRAHDIDITK